MADYIADTGLAAVLHSGLDGAQDTPPASLHRFRDKPTVSPAAALIDTQGDTTPVRVTEQAARTIEPAAALRSEHDGAQDSPPTSLPVIRNARPASPAAAPIDVQVHTTSVRPTEQAARTTDQPPTTLLAQQNQQPPCHPRRPWLLQCPL